MEADRGAQPLTGVLQHGVAVLLRVGVAGVILAALAVDAWVSRTWDTIGTERGMLAMGCIAVAGIAWAMVPQLAPLAAVGASTVSLAVTANLTDRLRFPFFTEFAVLPLLFGVALWRPTGWRWPVAAMLLVAGEAVCLRADNTGVRNILGVTALVLFGAAATVVGYARMKDRERRTSIELARRSERLELARELHDVVGHHVTGIVVLAQASRFAAASRTDGGSAPDTDRTLADIERAGLETLTSVRRLVGLLRDDAPTTAGPQLADVEQLVADLRPSHPQAALDVDPALRESWVPADLATTVHRIVQEATTNVRKHGDPYGPVTVALRRVSGSIRIEVQNRRLPGTVASGYGLVGMRERVQALGGTFAAGPAGDRVWIVQATLPLVGSA